MRPGNQNNNKRMRGRGRKGPNPLTRTFESNGPDVKIRGTALHVAEKYQQLARDAQASGDRIMSENYNQHAEHYLRIVAAAQVQVPPNQQPGRHDSDDGQELASGNGSHDRGRSDRGERGQSSDMDDLVDEDSPQPFIEDMPSINPSRQINGGRGNESQSESAGDEDDGAPKRRPRGTRGRGVKRPSSPGTDEEAVAETASVDVVASGEDEAPKPKRRAPRPRRVKPADESSDVETVTAGE